MPNPWQDCRKLPVSAASVLAALHLDEPATDALESLTEREWHDALAYCDRARLTLPLRDAARAYMPAWVRERVDANAAGNRERLRGIEETYRSLAEWLGEAGLEFVALKGLTHAALFGLPAESRVQYDIDLFLPLETVDTAQETLIERGYQPLPDMEDYPTDHLPALILKTGWKWSGDFFDTDIPLSIELHYRMWSEDVERFPAPGTSEFWARRTPKSVGGVALGMLCPQDALAYAALHLLKHLLRGSLRPFHAYEIARLLDSLSDDGLFWEKWQALHAPGLRTLEAVSFRLAQEWFGGRRAALVVAEMERLPAPVKAWFGEFAMAAAYGEFRSNKDELWLHLSLIASRRDKWDVILRRLVPCKIPRFDTTANIPESQLAPRQRVARRLRWAAYVAARASHHAAALPSVALSGTRWWWRQR